jgi:iron complex transport system substrate-binding protein
MTPQRIVSFLPSATEMVYALGLGDALVGVTHECDYPPEARNKPVVVRNVLPIETMSQSQIDLAVAERMRNGDSLYQIDERKLQELAPDLILTQNLCQVCAPSGNEVSQVLKTLEKRPEILWLTPKSVSEIFENLFELGATTGRKDAAQQIVDDCHVRIDRLKALTSKTSSRPRVFCMEWLDPVYVCGHWVPELVQMAGGTDELGKTAGDSVRVSWEEISKWAPEVVVMMPCGFNLQQTMKQIWNVFGPYSAAKSQGLSAFLNLPAVRNSRVYAVDANSYFARPGPRVIEGAELLAQIIHPELFRDSNLSDHSSSFQTVDVALLQGVLEEGKDYVVEGSAMVFTSSYLKRRGYCCDSGCRNCPY